MATGAGDVLTVVIDGRNTFRHNYQRLSGEEKEEEVDISPDDQSSSSSSCHLQGSASAAAKRWSNALVDAVE